MSASGIGKYKELEAWKAYTSRLYDEIVHHIKHKWAIRRKLRASNAALKAEIARIKVERDARDGIARQCWQWDGDKSKECAGATKYQEQIAAERAKVAAAESDTAEAKFDMETYKTRALNSESRFAALEKDLGRAREALVDAHAALVSVQNGHRKNDCGCYILLAIAPEDPYPHGKYPMGPHGTPVPQPAQPKPARKVCLDCDAYDHRDEENAVPHYEGGEEIVVAPSKPVQGQEEP